MPRKTKPQRPGPSVGPDSKSTHPAVEASIPDHSSPLPTGAIAADPTRQIATGMHVRRPYYTTTSDHCRSCGAPFEFTAEEQRHWYEVLQIPIERVRIICKPCGVAERRLKAANTAMGAALQALRDSPKAAPEQLAVAAVTLELHLAGGGGDIPQARGLARKAERVPELAEQARVVLDALGGLG